jgi:hypothetical protein
MGCDGVRKPGVPKRMSYQFSLPVIQLGDTSELVFQFAKLIAAILNVVMKRVDRSTDHIKMINYKVGQIITVSLGVEERLAISYWTA